MASRGVFVCLLGHASIALASFVNPDPVSLCSGGASPGQTACAAVPDSCCTNGECCAGGCCPLTAVCINKGRGDEGCCPIDDATTCGRVLPTLSFCSASPGPSVTCTAADSATWACPPDKACGVRFSACVSAPTVCGTTAGGGATPTPTPRPTSGGNAPTTPGGGSSVTGTGSAGGSGAAAVGIPNGGLVGVIGAFVVGVAMWMI